VALLEDIDRQLTLYRDDLASGFELRMTAVEKVLVEMEARGHAYFEDTMRIGRVMDLLNRARVQKEFEDRVVSDAPRQIERRVTELIVPVSTEDRNRMTKRREREDVVALVSEQRGQDSVARARLTRDLDVVVAGRSDQALDYGGRVILDVNARHRRIA